jgi:hypothetical protein
MNGMSDMQKLDERLADPLTALAGGDAVGYVGADVPLEVLLATGRPFGHLPWRADGETPWADLWLESSFPLWSRSILEQWHAGAFDALRDVVFSRAEDASQRLYYYVRELQARGRLRGPVPRIFDVALVPRESSLAHSMQSVLLLTSELGGDLARLADGIARTDALRLRLQQLQEARGGAGPWFEALARAAMWGNPEAWVGQVQSPAPAADGRPRVLLAGSLPPDGRLHQAAEEGGASVVAETHGYRLDRLGASLVEDDAEQPARRVARRVAARSVAPRAFLDAGQWVVRQARAARASAVVLWLTREDEGLAWQLPAQRAALAAAQLPCLVLPAAHWLGSDGAAERIRAFCAAVAR